MSRVYNILDPSLDLLSDLELVGKFREEISAVKGSLVTDLSGIRGFLVTVGDRVSSDAVRSGLDPNVVIVDLKEKRTNLQLNSDVMRGRIILHANNPPGRITREAWLATRASLDLAKIGIKTCFVFYRAKQVFKCKTLRRFVLGKTVVVVCHQKGVVCLWVFYDDWSGKISVYREYRLTWQIFKNKHLLLFGDDKHLLLME